MSEKNIEINCPNLNKNRYDEINKSIYNWLNSQAMNDLIKEFGSKIPNNLELKELSKWLLNFSEEWDYRKKQSNTYDNKTGENARWLIHDETSWSDEKKENIIKLSKELGLLECRKPHNKNYDYFLVLGGARLSCLLRTKLALELLKDNFTTNKIILLGSSRPIADSEREATDTYAINAKTEFDLLVASVENLFKNTKIINNQKHNSDNKNGSWQIVEYETDLNYPNIIVISAPSSEPEKRRANTADTYNFFVDKYELKKGTSLLLLTNQIYVPYQQMEAIRTLGFKHNLMVETIGFSPEWNGNIQVIKNTPNYLQEIRSTIMSIDRFIEENNKQ